ncbi:MAG: DEAD/DEAH box helicase [Actinomycetales bacterium]|nr:DEAD/DEAH box helicase [Actinomycetales bacterium]
MSSPTFGALGVPSSLVDVLAGLGITTPTPIQAATLPDSLAARDVLGRGRTGSGKTYAFLLPLVARLSGESDAAARAVGRPARRVRQSKRPRALILAPTRELATQIDEALRPLAQPAGLTSRTVFGGVGQGPQVTDLRRGVDIVVACPGRLEDLIAQGHVSLDAIEVTIIDEADHMADLGFLPSVRRLLDATPAGGQRMLFSATLDAAVGVLVRRYLVRPVTHEADSAQSPVATMTHHVLHVSSADHLPVLVDLVAAPGRTVVFTRTKHRAKNLARQLNARGIPAVELHGNLSQNARARTMAAFSDGTAQTLVATDIAARGIHVDDVALVVHADPPTEHKAYLHRSGRTARAGNSGTVITLMTDDQVRDVRDLTRKAGVTATTTRVTTAHPLLRELAPGEREYAGGLASAVAAESRSGRGGSGRGAGRGESGRGESGRAASGRGGSGRTGAGRSSSARAGSGRGAGTPGSTGRPSTSSTRNSAASSTRSQAGRPGDSRSTGRAPSAAAFSAGSRAGSGRPRRTARSA